MKKYWKSIVLLVMTVAGISTFYVNAQASGDFPEFNLTTVSGDAKAAKDVQLDVGYEQMSMQYEGRMFGNTFTVTSDGTKEWGDDDSYLEQLDGVGGNPQYAHLIADYRHFMRGKDPWSAAFDEDDDYLAYADVNYDFNSFEAEDYTLELAVLEKETGDDDTFAYQTDSGDKVIDYMDVGMVKKSGNQLNVFVNVSTRANEQNEVTRGEQIKVFTFDLDSHKLVDEQTLDELDHSKANIETDFNLLNPSDPETPSDYVVFRKQATIYDETEDLIQEAQTTDKGLLVYHVKTDQVEALKMPERLDKQGQVEYFDGKYLYFTETGESGLTILTYSIADGEIVSELQVDMDTQLKADNIELKKKNDRFYLGMSQVDAGEPTQVVIADTKTGKKVYEGEVKAESPSEVPAEASVKLLDLHVQKAE